MTTILTLTWLGVAVVGIWPITVAIVEHDRKKFPLTHLKGTGAEDWAFSIFFATVFSFMWPLALPPLLSWLLWRRVLRQPARDEAHQ